MRSHMDLYRLPITQVVVLLLPPASDVTIETVFCVENTRHEYRVIRMWEEDPQLLLNDPALLPLAPLAATTQPRVLLQQVAEQVNQLEAKQRPEIAAYVQILAGLKFEKDLIRQIFHEGMMRESVIYQEILAEGEHRGEQREKLLILRQLTRRIGEVPQQMRSHMDTLSLEQWENLGEALLDFETLSDLETWLRSDASKLI